MANRKKSTAQKRLAGTFRGDRTNQNAPVPAGEIGNAPAHMTDAEKNAWAEIVEKIPSGIAGDSDRLALEILVRLLVKFRKSEISGVEMTLLLRTISKFGLSPADRGGVEPVPAPPGPSKWG